jgi:peroxiredoxin family protein
MTELMDAPAEAVAAAPEPEEAPEPIAKVCIVVSKGSLEGVYPALIMANGARMEGIEAELFFTFFGMDVIRKGRNAKMKVATVGNPGMHMPTLIGAIPGMSWVATRMMSRQMEKLDIPPVPEFLEMISDSGGRVWACKASADMFGLTMDDFVPQVEEIITVGEFFERSAGAEIVFT